VAVDDPAGPAYGAVSDAAAAGRARHFVEGLVLSTVDNCILVCDARSLVRPWPVERILRGRGGLRLGQDPAFYERVGPQRRLPSTAHVSVPAAAATVRPGSRPGPSR